MNDILKLAVFPGTFDPFTIGHYDILLRASKLFANVIVAVAQSPNKKTLMSHQDRLESISKCCADFANVQVHAFSGMLVDFLQEQNADILVRGVRTVADYDYEVQLSGMYRMMMPNLEIVMLPTQGHLSFVSSTLVREVVIHNGEITKFVPPAIAQTLQAKYMR